MGAKRNGVAVSAKLGTDRADHGRVDSSGLMQRFAA
jgi:hypothetical protein